MVSKFSFKAIFGLKNFLLPVMQISAAQKQLINFDIIHENGFKP
jgi:hypothetical protein